MKQQIEVLQRESTRHRNPSRRRESLHFLPHVQQAYVPFHGSGSLAAEISALRLTYLQNGGNDQVILAHLQDLLVEAQQMEQRERCTKHLRKKNKKTHEPPRHDLNMELITLEIENQHLEDEILRLQLKRQRSVRRSKTSPMEKGRFSDMPTIFRAKTREKMKTLTTEIDLLKQELEIQRLRHHVQTSGTRGKHHHPSHSTLPPVEEGRFMTPPPARRFLDTGNALGPAPYDPVSGFVMFYDFLLGLDPTYRVCRLVVGLYNGRHEMGKASAIPPVHCETGNMPTFPENKRQNIAVLATKQAVPRVRPSPSISLVIELQASGGYDPYGQKVDRLVARGWLKLDIFDFQNRVISGQWRVPVRVLPVKPSLTTGEMNGVPQLDNAELYIRIVNARDADGQSIHTIQPTNAVFYKYPPLVAARPLFRPDSLHPSSYDALYRYATPPQITPGFGDDVDPPPPAEIMMSH